MAEKFDPRFNPAFQPGFEPSRDVAPPRPRAERPAAEPVAETIAPAQAEPANPSEDVPAVEKNPFERTLWVVSVAFVVGGIAANFWASGVNLYSPAGPIAASWQLLLRESAWSWSQPMVTVGLATAIALLFRRAINWKQGGQ